MSRKKKSSRLSGFSNSIDWGAAVRATRTASDEISAIEALKDKLDLALMVKEGEMREEANRGAILLFAEDVKEGRIQAIAEAICDARGTRDIADVMLEAEVMYAAIRAFNESEFY